jgi:hypothetical protein
MIPDLAKLERLRPDTVVGVPAGELAQLQAEVDAVRALRDRVATSMMARQEIVHQSTQGTGTCPRCGESVIQPGHWVTGDPARVNCVQAATQGAAS